MSAARILLAVLLIFVATAALADNLAVIVNRAGQTARFTLHRDGLPPRDYALEPGRSMQLSALGDPQVTLDGRRYQLAPGAGYALQRGNPGGLSLVQTDRRVPRAAPQRSPVAPADRPTSPPPRDRGDDRVVRIPVTLMVDEAEPARVQRWQRRLTARLDAASDIFERQAGVRFYAVVIDRWQSSAGVDDFQTMLAEFERVAKPGGGHVVIGFTSRLPAQANGRTDLGGTRGPLRSHILIRELSSHISEPERLEVLVHELGHFLGAVHSADADSVMRPSLGDRKSRAADFDIRFDPLNAQVIRLVGQHLNERRIRRLSQLPDAAKSTLAQLYNQAARALPQDPAAKYLLQLLRQR